MQIKKVFKLEAEDLDTQILTYLDNSAQVRAMLERTAQNELVETIVKRNLKIKEILSDKYDYILNNGDTVVFMDQTNEIRVYSNDDSNLEYTESPD